MIRAIHATEQICALPSIPTHDWATRAANAIASVAPEAIAGVLVADMDPQTLTIKPISTGVSDVRTPHPHALHRAHPDANHQAHLLQDKLERMKTLGFNIPEHASTQGLVAPISLLHPHWRVSPLGQIFASSAEQSPILAIIPICHEQEGFVLICMLAMNPQSTNTNGQHPVEFTSRLIGQLAPILSRKAKIALERVTNPKAWLTDREQEILDQLILGHSVRVIAENLDRSAHTVHDHVKNLHKKLNASSRGELIAKALGYEPLLKKQPTTAINPIILSGASSLSELKPGSIHHKATPLPHAKPLAQPGRDT